MDHANIKCEKCKGKGYTGPDLNKLFCNYCIGQGYISWIDKMMGKVNSEGGLCEIYGPLRITESNMRVTGLDVNILGNPEFLIEVSKVKNVTIDGCNFKGEWANNGSS